MLQNNFFYISRTEFWAYYLNSRDSEDLLKKNVDKTKRIRLFNEFVSVVNIETSAYCNRKCSYCPVAKSPRKQEFMRNELFIKILDEMKTIDYRGIFTLSLFNEPLADIDILERIKKVRAYCPHSYIRMNSNGDYLTREMLDELNACGLNEILITQHMNSDEEYLDNIAETKLKAFFDRIKLDFEITSRKDMHNISCDVQYKNIRLLVVTNNWAKDGTDRGGEVTELSLENRVQPCELPFREITIDMAGNARFCCNVYINSKSLGNINDTNVLDVYFGDEMVDIRREVLCFGNKRRPCKTCNQYDYATNDSNTWREHLLHRAIGTE